MTPSITLRQDIRLINLAFESERGAQEKIPLDNFRYEGWPRSVSPSQMPAQRRALARRRRHGRVRIEKSWIATRSSILEAPRRPENPGVESAQNKGDSPMNTRTPDLRATREPAGELDRLGDEIAELSTHIEAATARLLDLIREFDARGGWNTGFRS